MPFEDDKSTELPKFTSPKVSSKPSIFDNLPKKTSKVDFDKKVSEIQEKDSSYKSRATNLVIRFRKALDDKTLIENKNVFSKDVEKEILTEMIDLSVEINNDPEQEKEGMGSLSWISLLIKTSFWQRDKINKLEHSLLMLEEKFNLLLKNNNDH